MLIAVFAGGLLAGRVCLLNDMYVAGEGYIATVYLFSGPLFPAFLGSMIGRMSAGISRALPVSMLPVVLTYVSCQLMRFTKARIGRGALVAICMVSRLPLLFINSLLTYDIIVFSFALGLSAAIALSFMSAVGSVLEGETRDGLIIICIAAATLAGGLPFSGIGGFSLYLTAGSAAVMFAGAAFGAPYGAAIGAALGVVSALSGSAGMEVMGLLAAAGLLSGALRQLKKYAVLAGYCLSVMLISLLISNNPFSMVSWQTLLACGVLFMMVPQEAMDLAGKALTGSGERLNRFRYANQISKKIKGCTDCLRAISEAFDEITDKVEGENWQEMAPVLQVVAQQVCATCRNKERCWQTGIYDTYRVLCGAMVRADEHSAMYKTDIESEFLEMCLSPRKLVQSLSAAYTAYRIQLGVAKRIEEGRELLKEHIRGTASILDTMADGIRSIAANDDFAVMNETLRSFGANIFNIEMSSEGCRISCSSCGGVKRCAKMAKKLSEKTGKPYVVQSGRCGSKAIPCQIVLSRDIPVRISYGGAQTPMSGSICGDAFMTKRLENGVCLLAVADGMGSGARAAIEAKSALSLLTVFFDAGFDEDAVFSIINRALMLRSGSEMFAALDACFIDPVTHEYRFLKVGAAPSYIIRGGKVITITSPSIPLGIVDEVMPACIRRDALPEDVVILASDGFDGKLYEDVMIKYASGQPSKMAHQLMSLCEARGARDDITIVAASIKGPVVHKRSANRVDMWKSRVAAQM